MSRIFCRLVIAAYLAVCAIPGVSQASRSFRVASSAIQAFPQDRNIIFQNSWPGFTFGQLASEVDIVSVQPEFLGLPFAQFAQGPSLADGDPWAQQMMSLASATKAAGKPLMVQITLTKTFMVANAVYPDGLVVLQRDWAPQCQDLTRPEYEKVGDSYVNYALWIARTFSPQYFVIMEEPNLYYINCGRDTPSWELIKQIERRVYDTVKSEYPSMLLFPSFNLEAIYGFDALSQGNGAGFDLEQYYNLLDIKRDRLGLTSFPQAIGDFSKLPIDYYTRIQSFNPMEPRVVIAETGWNSATVNIAVPAENACVPLLSDGASEAAFLKFLLFSAYIGNFDVVTWWSNRDEMPAQVVNTCYPVATPPDFPECGDDAWCAWVSAARAFPPIGARPEYAELAVKGFGTMGLREYDGTPKDGLLSVWQQYYNLPIDGLPVPSAIGVPLGTENR
jgi:hypothetical protein